MLKHFFLENPVGAVAVRGERVVNLYVYSLHLPCLFPQHGKGAKHLRAIALEDWQLRILNAEPWPFIRGCIRTDGCSFVNRTGRYEYLSFAFSNMSEDIVRLFANACDRVGVRTRINQNAATAKFDVRINRRPCVALMERHVGVKA